MLKKLYTLFFLFVVVALTVYFPLRLHHSLGEQKAGSRSAILTSTFYNDAFYYLTIADNYSTAGFTTFDGERPTNGYNFLWQNILNISFTGVSDKTTQLEFTFILSVAMAIGAYLLLFLLLYNFTQSRILALFSIFPGFFYLLFSVGLGPHYSSWSIINGMESPLTVLLFVTFLFVSYKFLRGILNPGGYYLSSSFILSLLFLARFDDIFLPVAFLFVLLTFRHIKSGRTLMYFIILPLSFLIIYLLYNQINFGLALPVSGLIKSSFTFSNIAHIFNAVFTGRSFDFLSGEHLYARVLPLIIPLIFIPVPSGILERKYEEEDNTRFVFLLKVLKYYVVFKSIYILFFVEFWDQGFWYFYNHIIIFNLLIALIISVFGKNILKSKTFQALALLIIVFFVHSYFLNYESRLIKSSKLNKNNVEIIGRLINNDRLRGKIIEMDDGVIAYSSNLSCLSGFGLCIDKEGYEAIKKGEFLDYAYNRGYRYLASLNYFQPPAHTPYGNLRPEQFVRQPFFALKNENLRKWEFKTFFKNSYTGLVLIRFEKK